MAGSSFFSGRTHPSSVFDMTVAEGTLNAVIFYMNVVCVNRSSFFGHSQTPVIKVLMVFVLWMNLDLGIDACFYSGTTAFDKAVFQFIFPLYLWILAGIIIILCRKSIKVSKFFGKSAIKVLATIVLLSYAILFRAAIDALYQSRLTYTNSSGTHQYYSSVWRIDGNIPYWGTKHALLLALAVVVAAVTLPLTVPLMPLKCSLMLIPLEQHTSLVCKRPQQCPLLFVLVQCFCCSVELWCITHSRDYQRLRGGGL